jgi:thioredoxin reductase (NADPH)
LILIELSVLMKQECDVAIIGGGPAGISALIWCYSLGLRGVLLEQGPQLGGQLMELFHQVVDYPGLPSQNGIALRDSLVSHIRALELSPAVSRRIEDLSLRKREMAVGTDQLSAAAIVIATGARKRRLGIPGESALEGKGVSFSATRDHAAFKGKRVCVVGGGDSALEGSLTLAKVCESVTLIVRSDRPKGRREWLDGVSQNNRISVRTNTLVTQITGESSVTGIIVSHTKTGDQESLETDGVFIRIGITPNSEPFRDQLTLDREGYIQADQKQRTPIPMVYAAGDICRPRCFSVATAVGQAAIAVKDIAESLKSAGLK